MHVLKFINNLHINIKKMKHYFSKKVSIYKRINISIVCLKLVLFKDSQVY